MRMLFVMDPLETVDPKKDTTHLLMLGAARRGHECHYVAPASIALVGDRLRFQTLQVEPVDDLARPFRPMAPAVFWADEVDAVFLRTDPPFDQRYLLCTWLLDFMPPGRCVMNDPRAVRDGNEKIWAARFPDLMPETRVTADFDDVIEMVDRLGRVILKPTDQFGGRGVFLLGRDDLNVRAAFDLLTDSGRDQVIVQAFAEGARQGDKRVLLLRGEPLGAILRVAGGTDHRNNLAAGGKAVPTELTATDRTIIDRIRPDLEARGLDFVGIDILGDRLIEVNVTSPTCLKEMCQFTGEHLEERVIKLAESKVTWR